MDVTSKTENIYFNWLNYFNEAYNYALPYIINAFTRFYGEEYYSHIDSTIRNAKIDFILNEFSLYNDKFPDFMRRDLRVVNKYLKTIIKYLRNAKLDNDEKLLAYINALTFNNANLEIITQYIILLENKFGALAYAYYNEEVKKGVILPAYSLSDIDLIHELNHLVCLHILGLYGDGIVATMLFESIEMEELINQLTALIITSYLKESKVVLMPNIISPSYYDTKLPLVKEFYETFELIIKRVLITGDTNLLEYSLGSDNLSKLFEEIKREFGTKRTSPNSLRRIRNLNELMKNSYKKVTKL